MEACCSLHLGREPDLGARVWVEGMTGDTEQGWVVQNVLTAPEVSGTEVDGCAATLRGAVLGRQPSAGEQAYWGERHFGLDRDDLRPVREIWYTPEAVGDRITLHHRQRLGRAPSAGEVDHCRASEAASDLATKVVIAASDEGVATALRLQQRWR